MKKLIVTLLNLGLLAAVFCVWQGREYLSTPVGGNQAITVEIKQGDTLRPVLNDLESRKFIRYSELIYLYARLTDSTDIRRGSYELYPNQSPISILNDLAKGKVVTESLTIVEGLNRWQVRDGLAEAGWISAEEFDALCDDKDFLKAHKIPGPSCEGYLFPETYVFARGVSAEHLFETFFKGYRTAFEKVTHGKNGPMQLGEREFMTLASIVEKETGAAKERPRIACVFYNRLRAKPRWRLETDPTVIYAARLEDPNFDGNIKRSHLRKMKNPYNTYLNFGLPPGPIANSGLAAMKAVKAPIDCGDFFFVSKNNGEHIFCPTLNCHNAAVQKWQVNYFRRK